MKSSSDFSLAPAADLAVYYEADAQRYRDAGKLGLLELMPLARFTAHYQDTPSLGFSYRGQAIGGMILDDEELHFAVLASFHGRWAPELLAPAMDWVFALRPVVKAAVEADNPHAVRFLRRNGWTMLNAGPERVIFQITKGDLARQASTARASA